MLIEHWPRQQGKMADRHGERWMGNRTAYRTNVALSKVSEVQWANLRRGWGCYGQWSKVLFFFEWITFSFWSPLLLTLIALAYYLVGFYCYVPITAGRRCLFLSFRWAISPFAFSAFLSFCSRHPLSISFNISISSCYDLSPYLAPLCSRSELYITIFFITASWGSALFSFFLVLLTLHLIETPLFGFSSYLSMLVI